MLRTLLGDSTMTRLVKKFTPVGRTRHTVACPVKPSGHRGVEISRRPGLVQLVTGAVSCLLGLAGLAIAINTATGNGGPPVDTTNSSHSEPPSGLDGASMPSVVPASPTPSKSEATSDPTD